MALTKKQEAENNGLGYIALVGVAFFLPGIGLLLAAVFGFSISDSQSAAAVALFVFGLLIVALAASAINRDNDD